MRAFNLNSLHVELTHKEKLCFHYSCVKHVRMTYLSHTGHSIMKHQLLPCTDAALTCTTTCVTCSSNICRDEYVCGSGCGSTLWFCLTGTCRAVCRRVDQAEPPVGGDLCSRHATPAEQNRRAAGCLQPQETGRVRESGDFTRFGLNKLLQIV